MAGIERENADSQLRRMYTIVYTKVIRNMKADLLLLCKLKLDTPYFLNICSFTCYWEQVELGGLNWKAVCDFLRIFSKVLKSRGLIASDKSEDYRTFFPPIS